jgi:hypothetical protein
MRRAANVFLALVACMGAVMPGAEAFVVGSTSLRCARHQQHPKIQSPPWVWLDCRPAAGSTTILLRGARRPHRSGDHQVRDDEREIGATASAEGQQQSQRLLRRKSLGCLAAVVLLLSVSSPAAVPPAQAYYVNQEFPAELDVVVDGGLDGKQRKQEQIREMEFSRVSALTLGPTYKPLSALLWGSALWFVAGSRSNPVATPLANLVYRDKQDDGWLQDRNDGLFGDLPIPLLLLLALVFIGLGAATDTLLVNFLFDGDRNISLQLAGVSLIAAATLELGRIASGEKAPTREEADRDGLLEAEFTEFADKRLLVGGNCHRSDVVAAFRRYYSKYRQVDSEDYPLTNLEIEGLLKAWTARLPRVEMSSAGFYYGVQINKEADVFATR